MVDKSFGERLLPGLSILLVVFLLLAAATHYMASKRGAGLLAQGQQVQAQGVLSQRLVVHAMSARAGDLAAFDQLRELRPEIAADFGGIEPPAVTSSRGEVLKLLDQLLETQEQLQTAIDTSAKVRETMPRLLAHLGDLTALSSASERVALTPHVERFEIAGQRAQQDMAALASGRDSLTQVAQRLMGADDYLGQVVRGLNGDDSALGIAAPTGGDAQSKLGQVTAQYNVISEQIRRGVGSADRLIFLQNTAGQLSEAAETWFDKIRGSDMAVSGSALSRFLPLLLIGGSLLAFGGILVLYRGAADARRLAEVQAAQNDRNQQAILRLLDELGSLADGDLTVKATVTEDITGAIADSINYAVEALRGLVATINGGAIQIDAAARQTQASAAHLAKASENQSRQVMGSTESIANMAASIEEVSGNAERSADVARHSVDVAHKGGDAVRRTIEGMNTIRETIQETSKRIKRLGESSQEIGNIVELINDIADQTNILALNASIQASMAGEAGRGFAVVADEVQRLAEKSANATKQIEVLVRTIQADTNEAVISMERSTTDVVSGALLAENAGASLDEIEKVSNQIASLVQNISSTARQQATAAAGMTRNMGVLQEISAQTAENTGATSAAIGKLAHLAGELRKSVSGFTLPEEQEQQRSAPSDVRARTNGALSRNTAPRVGAA